MSGQWQPFENEDEETLCSEREDGQHCNCWYDNEETPCCACGE
jgi:hypothetical protein